MLIPIQDAAQAEHAMELARRASASEALVLHLNLRESYGGRRFALETDSEAARVVESTVLELNMAGIKATGQVRPALVDRAAGEITAEATEWDADLIVLGFPAAADWPPGCSAASPSASSSTPPAPSSSPPPAGRQRPPRTEKNVPPATHLPVASASTISPSGGLPRR